MAADPVFVACLKLRAQPVLVVGGGAIATGKAEGLAICGAQVTVIAPEATSTISDMASSGQIQWQSRRYNSGDMDAFLLVVAATGDTDLHKEIYAEATSKLKLVNVVDVPELCTFIVPAIHRSGPITVAVSSAGSSPALAKRLRDELAAVTDQGYGDLAQRLAAERVWARENLGTYQQRKVFFESIVLADEDPVRLAADGNMAAVDALINRCKQAVLRGD